MDHISTCKDVSCVIEPAKTDQVPLNSMELTFPKDPASDWLVLVAFVSLVG